MNRLLFVGATALGTCLGICTMLAVSAPAWAHVEISPDAVTGSQPRTFTVEVPTEKETPTTGVELRVPDGFEVSGVESPAGWQGEIRGNTLIWSGGEIPVAQSEEFTFRARAPEGSGEFTFVATQEYKDGSVVKWDGKAESETPAPVVTVAKGGPGAGSAHEHQHSADDHGSGGDGHALSETGGPSPAILLGACALALALSATALARMIG
jgi:uncharacterized protein YcnI